jgi:hypothetical protein
MVSIRHLPFHRPGCAPDTGSSTLSCRRGTTDVINGFRRGAIRIDVLSIDHVGNADLRSVPPAQTVAVPGGRQAINRLQRVSVALGEQTGTLPLSRLARSSPARGAGGRGVPEPPPEAPLGCGPACWPARVSPGRRRDGHLERRRIRDLDARLGATPDAWQLFDEAGLVRADAQAALRFLGA